MINKLMYRNATDGLCGNDDCGQMSAWYIFSTLGFYPVCPGNSQYAIGSPGVTEAVIQVSYGKTLKILAEGLDDDHIYVSSVTLNGKPLQSMFIDHKDLLQGGELVFRMTAIHP